MNERQHWARIILQKDDEIEVLREALEEIASADPFYHKGSSFYAYAAYAVARAEKALAS